MFEGHSTVLYRGAFYIFGGFDHGTQEATDALYRVDLADVDRHRSRPQDAAKSDAQQTGGSPYMMPGHWGSAQTGDSGAAPGPSSLRHSQSDEVTMHLMVTTGPRPSPRAFHACCVRGPFMVVWGGTAAPGDADADGNASLFAASSPQGSSGGSPNRTVGGSPQNYSNANTTELFALNLDTMGWSVYHVGSISPSVKMQQVPQRRCHSTLVCSEDALLLYGGFPTAGSTGGDDDVTSFCSNEWCVFKVSAEAQCEALLPVGASPAVWGHSSVYAHRCLMVFGGVDALANEEVNALSLYNLEENRWRWAEFAQGTGPCSRAMHSACVDDSTGCMIVIGGFTTNISEAEGFGDPFVTDEARQTSGEANTAPQRPSIARQLNDVWAFSLETGMWEQLWGKGDSTLNRGNAEVSVQWVAGRSGHTSVCLDHKVYVFGGLVDKSEVDPTIHQTLTHRGARSLQRPENGSRGGTGGLIIFDIPSRTWTTRTLVRSSTATIQTKPSLRSGTARGGNGGKDFDGPTTRESIIDRFLNMVPHDTNDTRPAPAREEQELTRRLRTVASRLAKDNSASAETAQPTKQLFQYTTSVHTQEKAVTSAFQQVEKELSPHRDVRNPLRRSASPSSPPRQPHDNTAASFQSPGFHDLPYASASSPAGSSRYSVPPYGWEPSSAPPEASSPLASPIHQRRVGEVVTTLNRVQNAADLQLSLAEQARRAKLLQQFMHTTADWSISFGGLQEDEVSNSMLLLRSPESNHRAALASPRFTHDKYLVSSPHDSQRVSTPSRLMQRHQDVSPAGYGSNSGASASRPTVLDSDEQLPNGFSSRVAAHPLDFGPWIK